MKRRRRKKTTTLGELLITEKMRKRAKSFPAVGFIDIDPRDFLKLTTQDEKHLQYIVFNAKPVEQYNQWVRDGEILVSPYLNVDMHTGRVCGHEGRHRAAALIRDESAKKMKVAVVLKDRGCSRRDPYEEKGKPWTTAFRVRWLGAKDLPDALTGQVRDDVEVKVDKSTFDPLYPQGWHKPDNDPDF